MSMWCLVEGALVGARRPNSPELAVDVLDSAPPEFGRFVVQTRPAANVVRTDAQRARSDSVAWQGHALTAAGLLGIFAAVPGPPVG